MAPKDSVSSSETPLVPIKKKWKKVPRSHQQLKSGVKMSARATSHSPVSSNPPPPPTHRKLEHVVAKLPAFPAGDISRKEG